MFEDTGRTTTERLPNFHGLFGLLLHHTDGIAKGRNRLSVVLVTR